MAPIDINAEVVSDNWPLSGVHVEGAVNKRGTETRRVFILASDQGKFAAKAFRSSPRIPRDDGPDHPHVPPFGQLPYLADRGYPNAPRVVPTKTGAATATIGDLIVGVFEYLPERLQPHRRSRAETWRELGDAAARLNAHTDYPLPWGISIPRAIEEVSELAAKEEYRDALRGLLARLAVLDGAHPGGLVHGEINEGNAGRRADGSVVILDWDGGGNAATALDYGYPLITQFLAETTGEPDTATARAFFAAYRDAGGSIDRELLFPAALFHALRYMWFHNTLGRWRRIAAAVETERQLIKAVL